MADKGSNLFRECAAECVHLCPQEEECTLCQNRYRFCPERIVKCAHLAPYETHIPAGNYMFKINNKNTRTRCEICSKLTIKTPERR